MKYLAVVLAVAVAAVALFVQRQRGPTPSPLEVGWTPTGFRLAFTREPAGPAAVRLTSGASTRTEPTTSTDGVHHALDVRGLLPGQPLIVTPLAGEREGAPVVLTSRGSALVDLDERDASDGTVTVTFKTAVPARCKLQVQAAGGLVWLEPEPEAATAHALRIPAAHAPFLGAVAVEIAAGDETKVEPVVPTPRLRTQRRLRLADELAPKAGRAIVAFKTEYIAKIKGGDAKAAVLPPLPAWLAEELGGAGGALDDPDLPPRRKDALYRTILSMGDADRLRTASQRVGWHRLPHARDFGAGRKPRFERATLIPLMDPSQNLNAPLALWNEHSLRQATDEELEKAGNPKGAAGLIGGFEMDRFDPRTRVELHTRARIPRRRALEATINDVYLVRLNDVEESDGEIHDYYAAFDAAYLITGWNRIVIEDYVSPEDPDPDAKTVLEPPGVQIRIWP